MNGRRSGGRGSQHSSRTGGGGQTAERPQNKGVSLFDPGKSETELLDTLAQEQADKIDKLNSTQLRRFFGDVKEQYRRFEAAAAQRGNDEEVEKLYREKYEPLFKMLRSKVAYATRAGGQSKIPPSFASFLSEGVRKVNNHREYRLFVKHFEAVVGFLYGMGKVQNR